eukprot:m.74492 g.74492  ORF g.74492 m.74492 type:complete len:56 (-) comp50344_c0_seq1:1001-1168(-)
MNLKVPARRIFSLGVRADDSALGILTLHTDFSVSSRPRCRDGPTFRTALQSCDAR